MISIRPTADGSLTLYHEQIGEHYHSVHGAQQESLHVFVEAGLRHAVESIGNSPIHLLEVGFGTGLNFLLSQQFALLNGITLHYTGIEINPLPLTLIEETNYGSFIHPELWNIFRENYPITFEKGASFLNGHWEMAKPPLLDFHSSNHYDLLYYDAFSVRHQPEMWSEEALGHACSFLKEGGFFVTYAITGELKRTLKKLGLEVEKLPGPPGKREMLRARKGPLQKDVRLSVIPSNNE